MKQIDEKTWWAYLDGTCEPAKRSQIEQLLSQQPELKEDLLLRSSLHEQLKGMELESPSSKFTANVLAALPQKKRVISPTEPLIHPKMKRVIGASLALLFLTLLALPFFLASNTPQNIPSSVDKINPIAAWWSDVALPFISSLLPSFSEIPQFPSISSSIFPWVIVLVLGFTLLLTVDSIWGRKLQAA